MRRLALATLLAIACTDGGLGDAEFRGDPIARVPMRLFESPPTEPIAVAVFWADRMVGIADGGQFFEQPGTAIHVENSENAFDFPLFEPPPARFLMTSPQGSPIAVGHLAGYVDANRNLRHDPGEQLTGGAQPLIVAYLPQAVDGPHSPTGLPLAAGYHALHGPLLCDEFPTVTEGDCGVPLGMFCETDADCGPGSCHEKRGIDTRVEKSCVIHEPPPDGCRPSTGRLNLRRQPGPDGHIGDWVMRCARDEDCPRADGDRVVFCMPSNELCRGAGEWSVKFDTSLPTMTFCMGE